MSTVELVALHETLAATNVPKIASAVFGPGVGMLRNATPEVKEKYLLPMLRGETHGSFGFTEPPDRERTVAVIDGDSLMVTGQKSYVTGGETADWVGALCNLRTRDGEKAGTSLVIVDLRTEDGKRPHGVVFERIFRSIDSDTPSHAYIRFDAVRVPRWSTVGTDGMLTAMQQIRNVRLVVSAQAVGTAMWAMEAARRHVTARRVHGKPLSENQAIRIRYATMHAECFAARAMLYRTARLLERGDKAKAELIATKIFCTEMAGRVVDGCVQLVGGEAIVVGHPLEATYRRVRQWRFAEGESDVLRGQLAEQALSPKGARL